MRVGRSENLFFYYFYFLHGGKTIKKRGNDGCNIKRCFLSSLTPKKVKQSLLTRKNTIIMHLAKEIQKNATEFYFFTKTSIKSSRVGASFGG